MYYTDECDFKLFRKDFCLLLSLLALWYCSMYPAANECPRILAHLLLISSSKSSLSLESIAGQLDNIWLQCASEAGSHNIAALVCFLTEMVGLALQLILLELGVLLLPWPGREGIHRY